LNLSLDTREVGYVMVVSCRGRIVAGGESELLSSHLARLLRDRRAIVLNLQEVGFVDSSGLGAIVRGLNNLRQAHGDLKLSSLTPPLRKVLEISHLGKLFEIYDCEEKAVAAFYGPDSSIERPPRTGATILCVDSTGNVLSYLRELLLGSGYDVQTSSHLGDTLLLLRVARFDLLVLGPGVPASARESIREASAALETIELTSDFSTLDAGEAAAGLLEEIESRLTS
jgi:anti-sigma B factor antagonist